MDRWHKIPNGYIESNGHNIINEVSSVWSFTVWSSPFLYIRYRIFSIKRPRRLFKTWPQGPGVYLKPAFNRGMAFINEVKFSSIFGLIYYFTFFETPCTVCQGGTISPLDPT